MCVEKLCYVVMMYLQFMSPFSSIQPPYAIPFILFSRFQISSALSLSLTVTKYHLFISVALFSFVSIAMLGVSDTNSTHPSWSTHRPKLYFKFAWNGVLTVTYQSHVAILGLECPSRAHCSLLSWCGERFRLIARSCHSLGRKINDHG